MPGPAGIENYSPSVTPLFSFGDSPTHLRPFFASSPGHLRVQPADDPNKTRTSVGEHPKKMNPSVPNRPILSILSILRNSIKSANYVIPVMFFGSSYSATVDLIHQPDYCLVQAQVAGCKCPFYILKKILWELSE